MPVFQHPLSDIQFMPHGHCYFWEPYIMWSHALADGIIAAAYCAIPVTLVHIFRKRKDFTFIWIMVLFSVFIFGCGVTHIFDVINIWHPIYRLDSAVRIITAAASVGTAVVLVRITPGILNIPSAQQWQTVNEQVQAANAQLQAANEELRAMNEELAAVNRELQRTNQELDQSNQELERFAYVASHDLQEPLRKVKAFGGLLRKELSERLTETPATYLTRMENAVDRMHRLVNDLLVFSRTTRLDTSFEATDLNQVMDKVLADLEVRIQETGATVEVPALPLVRAVGPQMEQLFANLAGNALKFAQPGVAPVVRLAAGPLGDSEKQALSLDPALPYVRVTVSDNGIGFEPEYAEKIFEIFQRLHTRQEYEGTGIGLAICKRIVERHGGVLYARSGPGEGAVFNVILPTA